MSTKKLSVVLSLVMLALLMLVPILAGCAQPAPAPSPTPAPKPAPAPAPAPTTPASAPTPTAAAKPITLKIGTIWAKGQPLEDAWNIGYMELIEQRTNGRVKWDYYPAQQLVKTGEMLESTGKGIIDVGCVVYGYYGGILPLFTVLDIPFVGESLPEKMDLLKELFVQPDMTKYFDQFNVKPIWRWATDWELFHTKKPLNKVDDMKGMRIRVSGGEMADMIQTLGGAPIAISSADTYLALQRGTVDGALMHATSAFGWKWYEGTKYTTVHTPPLTASTGMYIINRDTWNKLPKDIQDIINGVSDEWTLKMTKAAEGWTAEYVAKMKAQGQEIITLGPEETARWKEKLNVPQLLQNWATKNGAAGERIRTFLLSKMKK